MKGSGRDRREKHQCEKEMIGCLSNASRPGARDEAYNYNQDACPQPELNLRPFSLQADASIHQTGQGSNQFLNIISVKSSN